jgi:hypothetical protein
MNSAVSKPNKKPFHDQDDSAMISEAGRQVQVENFNHFFLFRLNAHNMLNTHIYQTAQHSKIHLQHYNCNRVLSRSLLLYGPQQSPLKITPLLTPNRAAQDLYTITGPNRVLSRSLHHYGAKKGSSQDLCIITKSHRVLSRYLHHHGTNQGLLKISTPLRTQSGSSQDLYTITGPNRVLSRSLHHYGPKKGPLKISTSLRNHTGSSQDIYTITEPIRVLSRSPHHYGPKHSYIH